MNLQKMLQGLKQNYIFYLMGFSLILGIKYFYSRAGSDELKWILAPTTRLVTLLCGIPFSYESNVGYVNISLRFLIAPSCCGIQFMAITIATLIFSFVHRMEDEKDAANKTNPFHLSRRGLCWTFASIAASYPLTILVNGMRIVLAIYIPLFLENGNMRLPFLTPEKLHTAIGAFVYFVSLLTIYRIAGYISLKAAPKPHQDESLSCTEPGGLRKSLMSIAGKCFAPAFWYFFIVLGIPFLNRACQKGGERFLEYAALVASICLPVLLASILVGLAHRLVKRR